MDQVGGVARIETDKVNWLVEHGYDVTLCDIEDWNVQPYYPLNPRVHFVVGHLPTTPGGLLTRLRNVWHSVQKIRAIIDDVKPDVIINAHCPVVTWILPFVFRGIPKITEMHQSYQGLEVFNSWAMSKWMAVLHLRLVRLVYGLYNRFVTLTNADRVCWHLPNSVCIPNFSNVPITQHVAVKHKRIVMLARLMPQKRIDLMIRVWALIAQRHPDWQVRVLGEGMERNSLQRQIDEAGLSNSFLLCGAVKNVSTELEQADILCLTSEYEGFGIVLIEAMRMGVPVLSMEYVGVHDIIEHNTDGVVVAFGNVEKYACELERLMLSEVERKRLAHNAYQSVRRFDKETVMQKWVELFQAVSNC